MRTELVEIYSDRSNAAVLRHPGRNFPGVLIQGDTLASIVQGLGSVRFNVDSREAQEELKEIHERLSELLAHYKAVLLSHSIELPFHE